jgi:hypothetical protein
MRFTQGYGQSLYPNACCHTQPQLQEQAGLLAAGYDPELAAEVGRPELEAAAAILRKMPPHDFVQKQVRQRAG